MALWSSSNSDDPREQALRHRDAAERLAGAFPPLLVEADGKAYPGILYISRNDAAGLTYSVETSTSLDAWSAAVGLVPVTNQNNGNGTTTVVLRGATPASDADTYYRLRVVSQ